MIKQILTTASLFSTLLLANHSLASEVVLTNNNPSLCTVSNPQTDDNVLNNCTSVTLTEDSENSSFTIEYKFPESDMIYTTDDTYTKISYYEGHPFYLYFIRTAILRNSSNYKEFDNLTGFCAISRHWDVILCLPELDSYFSNLYIE